MAIGLRAFGKLDIRAFVQHRRDDHEDDQHNQHHVHHRGHVDVRYRWRGFFKFHLLSPDSEYLI